MNERSEMNTQEFAECLDRWGSDLVSWPSTHQAAARALLTTSERAVELLAEADALDRWLTSASDHQAPVGLARRIVNRIPEQDFWQHSVDWFSAAPWRPAVAATCMLLVGFAIGLAVPEFDDEVMLDDVSMLAFSPTYQELDDAQEEPQDAQQ